MGEAWIIDAVRTPRGKGKKEVGSLSGTHPQELMATTLRALADRNTIDPKAIDDSQYPYKAKEQPVMPPAGVAKDYKYEYRKR